MKVLFDNGNIFPMDGELDKKENISDSELDKNENISNSEDLTDSIDNHPQNTDQSTSIHNDDCYHKNQKHPKVKILLNIRF